MALKLLSQGPVAAPALGQRGQSIGQACCPPTALQHLPFLLTSVDLENKSPSSLVQRRIWTFPSSQSPLFQKVLPVPFRVDERFCPCKTKMTVLGTPSATHPSSARGREQS